MDSRRDFLKTVCGVSALVLGPVLLGRLFDTVGRKVMIALTYAMSGILLALTLSDFLSRGWLAIPVK